MYIPLNKYTFPPNYDFLYNHAEYPNKHNLEAWKNRTLFYIETICALSDTCTYRKALYMYKWLNIIQLNRNTIQLQLEVCGITGIPVYHGMQAPWYRTAVQQSVPVFPVFLVIDKYFTFWLIFTNKIFKLKHYHMTSFALDCHNLKFIKSFLKDYSLLFYFFLYPCSSNYNAYLRLNLLPNQNRVLNLSCCYTPYTFLYNSKQYCLQRGMPSLI